MLALTNLIYFNLLEKSAKLPVKAYQGDAGFDLFLCEDTIIEPSSFLDSRTGISVAFPSNMWGRITGRSSTWRVWHLQVIEGIIDTGYRGELCVGIFNPTKETVVVPCGTRLAQLILHEHVVDNVAWVQISNALPSSERGSAGFGSSGK